MIKKQLSELHENPNNRRNVDKKNYQRLLDQMRMGDHSIFLITEDGMVVDGNHRLKAAKESGWTEVDCKVLSFEHDPSQGYYALIDGQVVKDNEVIPYYYPTIEAGITAYALSRNSQVGYYNDEILNAHGDLGIEWEMFTLDINPPQDLEEIIKKMSQEDRKKKLALIIPCDDEVQLEQRFSQITDLGIPVKKK